MLEYPTTRYYCLQEFLAQGSQVLVALSVLLLSLGLSFTLTPNLMLVRLVTGHQ